MANKIRAVIPCDLAGHGQVNVSSLGQSKKGCYMELDLSNQQEVGTKQMKPAVDNGGDA